MIFKYCLFFVPCIMLILNLTKMQVFKKISIVSSLAICLSSFAQQITVDNTVTAQDLIENTLIQGCIEASNISSPVNGSVSGIGSFGYFEQAGSNFPFQSGIVLTTGNANSAGNTINTAVLNEGDTNWGTDTDLESVLGISGTLNASSIEFDFISISNTIEFNYILASEEYFGNFPCNYSDGFALLIREAGTGDPYTNIALIPGTTTPVNTMTIHDEITVANGCPAANPSFFEGFNLGDTNYNGQTTVLTATASIQPDVFYQVKLVIADQSDQNYDSAVFIQANSFDSTVDLGPDLSTCSSSYTLNGEIGNTLASYSWYKDNVLIVGENQPTYEVTDTGTYRVEIDIPLNGDFCTLEDSVNITLSTTQTSSEISDFELCDDTSNDGIEFFNLNSKNNEAIASVLLVSNYTVSYYLNNADAQAGINALTSPYQNISSPQTIFTRIESNDTGCLAFNAFNLIVNPLPEISDPTPLEVCDDEIADGFTAIDLSVVNSEITNGQTNLVVTYHNSASDAALGINPLALPFNNSSVNQQIFVSVLNPQTGCISTTTLDITVLDNPVINTQNHYIDACDQDHDGFANFDLTSIIPDVIGSLTDVTITFHETNQDAIDGINAIANDTNYANINFEEQIVYIRVEDNATGCASITPIEIHTNLLLTATILDDISFCDFENDGTEDIDFNSIEDTILTEFSILPGYSVTFYETETDRDNQTNPIDTDTEFTLTNTSQTFYIELFSPTCSEVSEVNLILVPIDQFEPIPNQTVCDEDQDQITDTNLSSFNNLVTAGLTGYSVTYFLSENDADNFTNPLPNLYTNTTNPFTVFSRITSNATGCYDITSFEITVLEAPNSSEPTSITICDNDFDGFFNIDLVALIPEIVTNTTDRAITFHNTQLDAENGANAITNPDIYNAQTEFIYIRITNTITGCHSTERLTITINTLPVFIPITDFEVCENNSDGFADFILETKDLEILNAQTGKEVLYYRTQADADNRVNAINKTIAYSNTANPQTIFVRVENITDINCFATSSFNLAVGSNPVFTEPTDYTLCDDASNDGTEQFNFNEKISEISAGSTDNLNVTFYTSQANAETGSNPLPLNYTNTSNPQQIYVQINNGTVCNSLTSFIITVIPAPEVNAISPLLQCDDAYDGTEIFDITIAEQAITEARLDNLELSYFGNLTDAETNTNQITNPENYTNITNPQTAYLKIRNIVSNCIVYAPIELIVNLPPVINDFGVFDICDNPTNSFNLNEINPIITDETDALITYFANVTDAQANTNALDTNYTYNTNFDALVARLENPTTNCEIIYQFNLNVNPLPIANQPDDLVACDDVFNDGAAEFNFQLQDATILGGQNSTQFSVTYFASQEHAETNSNALNFVSNGIDEQTIFARVENNQTLCFSITSFQLEVIPYPFVPQSLIECDADYDGITTFNLTTSETELSSGDTDSIIINYFESITDLENDTNPITNPDNYTNFSNPQTVFIKVLSSEGNCFNYVPLQLNVNLPPSFNAIEMYNACENDTNTFNLTEVSQVLINSTINTGISYFDNPTDAENNTNPLDPEITLTTDIILYARIQFITTGCYFVYPFNLILNTLPIANQPPNLITCDDNSNDGFENFDLTLQNATILGTQNAANYTITYHDNELNAENAINPLTSPYNAFDNDVIFARIENNTVGCFNITSFSTLVNRTPNVNIPSQVLCLDDLPLVVSADTFFNTDTYLWSTNATTSEIEITETGTYTVTVTTEANCQTTRTFSVTESETANVEFIDVLDFSDPNNITVTITGIGDYLYQLDDGNPQESNVFENVSLGYHTVTIIDVNGCAAVTREVLVIDYPKFFTPNGGDDINPTWHIIGIETLPGSSVTIFDRYGKFLKHLRYNDIGWDGTYRGFNMPASDYWFIAQIQQGGIAFEVKGHFALKR